MRPTGMFVLILIAVAGAAGVSRALAGASPTITPSSETSQKTDAGTLTYPGHPGIATFYGADFQGKTMANGEVFDMHDPTIAASNGYPLGARLLIRRAAGSPWDQTLSEAERRRYYSAAIVVTVTDRGRFTHDLDLSRAAFTRLGREDEGRIAVTITPLAPGENASSVLGDGATLAAAPGRVAR